MPSTSTGAALVQEQSFDFVAAVEHKSMLERLRLLVSPTERPTSTGSAGVEHKSMLERLRLLVSPTERPTSTGSAGHEILLVSSPGFGVLDSGYGKTIIGEQTLHQFKDLLLACGLTVPAYDTEINHFRYGNGHSEISEKTVKIPVRLGGRYGAIKAAICQRQSSSANFTCCPADIAGLPGFQEQHPDAVW